MPDTLSQIRSDLEKRLKELEPLVIEHTHVRQALDALKGAGASVARPVRNGAKRATSAKTSARPAPSGSAARGRPRGSGARAQQALKLVHSNPGITIAEMAKKLKIKPNYLYRVLPELEKAGHIKKRDKGYHKADD
jgi:predicted Rossmann fold nucleotide-binding protein DprA/Smf involved in DNA uptake